MNAVDFIRNNISRELAKRGLPVEAVEYGINYYNRVPNAARPGKIYDECLAEAIKMAKIIKGNK